MTQPRSSSIRRFGNALRISGLLKEARQTGWNAVRNVRAHEITSWRAGRKQSSPKNPNLYFRAIRSFLNWLVANEVLTDNPLAGVKRVKESKKVRARRAISDDEANRLLAFAPSEGRINHLIALHTGLRRYEIQ